MTSTVPPEIDQTGAATRRPLRLAKIAHRFQKNNGQGRVNYEVARAALGRGMHLTLVTTQCGGDRQLSSGDVGAHPPRQPADATSAQRQQAEGASWIATVEAYL